jgi:hypothetical protein
MRLHIFEGHTGLNKTSITASLLALVLSSSMGAALAQGGLTMVTPLVHETSALSKIEFEAHRVENNVELKWVVSGFVKYFSVERSLDHVSWEPILNMTGSNQTYNRTEYFDIDYEVPSVKLFYRVRYVLYSGESITSNVSFVPAFDDLSAFQERMIQTLSDPIKAGMLIDLYFINFEREDLLLVLRDQCAVEYFAKVQYDKEANSYVVMSVSGDIPSGQYLITASSKKHVYSSKLRIELKEN